VPGWPAAGSAITASWATGATLLRGALLPDWTFVAVGACVGPKLVIPLGAYLGGAVITAGLGYSATNGPGALLAAGGVAVAVIAAMVSRRQAAVPGPAGTQR